MYRDKDLEDDFTQEVVDNEKNRKSVRILKARDRAKNVIIAILFATTLFGAFQYSRAVMLRRMLDNAYTRTFHELVGYVQNVQIKLMKANMTSSPELTAVTLNDVWHEANAAESCLTQLPVSMGVLQKTEKFLSQVADLSKSISKQNTYGQPISEEQLSTIANLHTFAVSLEESLSQMHSDLNNGNLNWEKVALEEMSEVGVADDGQEGQDAQEASTNMQKAKDEQEDSQQSTNSFSTMNGNFEEMPTLIYDGPYSEHLMNQKPLGLTGEQITEAQAKESLKKFMNNINIKEFTKVSDNNNGVINTFNFRMNIEQDGKSSVAKADVSVIGGHVVWLLANRDVEKASIDIKEATSIATKFLADRGYPNMKDTYYIQNDGIATINFAYTEDEVTYYTDLMKVKVALDNGDIVGFESKGYLMNHRPRDYGQPSITQAQAREKVTRGESVSESGLAVIPTDYGTEILCYEFIGKLGDQDFLVYINANTGVEEQVLVIINSDEGILTM